VPLDDEKLFGKFVEFAMHKLDKKFAEYFLGWRHRILSLDDN
jgi:hypothetical protein